jgi:hypothetical protein
LSDLLLELLDLLHVLIIEGGNKDETWNVVRKWILSAEVMRQLTV